MASFVSAAPSRQTCRYKVPARNPCDSYHRRAAASSRVHTSTYPIDLRRSSISGAAAFVFALHTDKQPCAYASKARERRHVRSNRELIEQFLSIASEPFREVPAVYQIRLPAPALSPFIECYWFLSGTLRPSESLEELIFTDARADIVFTFASPYVRKNSAEPGDGRLIRASNVDGQRRYPVRILQHGDLLLVGVRFRPGGLSAFVAMPVHELTGQTVPLSDAFGPAGRELEGRLFDRAGDPQGQSDLLDRFFLARLAAPPERHRVMTWAEEIERSGGLIAISELSRRTGISVRSVDRLFQRVIGLPPKFFARTVRFQQVHRLLLKHPQVRWDEIVASHGYFDQSHFAKDIASMTGVDPNAYRAFLARRRESPPPNHVQFLHDNRRPAVL